MPRSNIRATELENRSDRSEEHTSELQSHVNLVCRLLLEKKNKYHTRAAIPMERKIRRQARRSGAGRLGTRRTHQVARTNVVRFVDCRLSTAATSYTPPFS